MCTPPPPPLRLGGGILEFCFFGGGQNIFDFRRFSYERLGLWGVGGLGLCFVGGQFILCPFSHFEIKDFKN